MEGSGRGVKERRGQGRGHGLRVVREEAELLAADVETGGADEGAAAPGGTRAGCDGAGH